MIATKLSERTAPLAMKWEGKNTQKQKHAVSFIGDNVKSPFPGTTLSQCHVKEERGDTVAIGKNDRTRFAITVPRRTIIST